MTILPSTAACEDMVRATISKWGNSLALRIPQGLAEDAALHEGSVVDLRVEDGCLVAARIDDLQSLLSKITPENIHDDAFAMSPRGNEVL